MSWSNYIDAGFVWAPYVPLVITPTIADGPMGALGSLDYIKYRYDLEAVEPDEVMGNPGVKSGDLIRILSPEKREHDHDHENDGYGSGIYLGSFYLKRKGPMPAQRGAENNEPKLGHILYIDEAPYVFLDKYTAEILSKAE